MAFKQGGSPPTTNAIPGSSYVVDDSSNGVFTKTTGGPDIMIIENDFLCYNTTAAIYWPWHPATEAGAGQVAGMAPSTAANPGIVRLDCGTLTTGYAGLMLGESSGANKANILLGGGYHELLFIVNISTLSTVGEEFAVYFGLSAGFDAYGTPPGTNGCFFQYKRGTSVNWQGITRSGGVETTATGGSNVAVATGFNLFKMTINAGATSVAYFVNGTNIGTSASNIPTGTTISAGIVIEKSAGTTARTVDIDYFRWYHKLTTSRF